MWKKRKGKKTQQKGRILKRELFWLMTFKSHYLYREYCFNANKHLGGFKNSSKLYFQMRNILIQRHLKLNWQFIGILSISILNGIIT